MRVDSSSAIGTGHFMRSCALAQYLSQIGIEPTFVSALCLPNHLDTLASLGFGFHRIQADIASEEDAEATLRSAKTLGASLIVLDGYGFLEGYQKKLRSPGVRVAIFDDYAGSTSWDVDTVINYNLYATKEMYNRVGPSQSLILGPRFAVLRPQFVNPPHREPAPSDSVRRILVTLGGADSTGMTQWALKAVLKSGASFEAVRVIVGKDSRIGRSLLGLAGELAGKVQVINGTDDMPQHMKWADLAITAGGTTTYELLYLRVPFITIVVADNQRLNAAEMERRGISPSVIGGPQSEFERLVETIRNVSASAEVRSEMIARVKGLVDGYGGPRLASILAGSPIWLRAAMESDEERIWRWANDPLTRKWSFSSDPIPWTDHDKWFQSKNKDSNSVLLVANTIDDEPIGVVRIDKLDGVGRLSITLEANQRGHGYGSHVIELGCRMAAKTLGVDSFDAFVKPGNEASIKTFRRAGFVEKGQETIQGQQCVHLILGRDH